MLSDPQKLQIIASAMNLIKNSDPKTLYERLTICNTVTILLNRVRFESGDLAEGVANEISDVQNKLLESYLSEAFDKNKGGDLSNAIILLRLKMSL